MSVAVWVLIAGQGRVAFEAVPCGFVCRVIPVPNQQTWALGNTALHTLQRSFSLASCNSLDRLRGACLLTDGCLRYSESMHK